MNPIIMTTAAGSPSPARAGFSLLFFPLLVGGIMMAGCSRRSDVVVPSVARADEAPGDRQDVPERPGSVAAELRGVWVSDVDSQVMLSRDNMTSLAERIAGLNMNALYPVVWSQGETFYPSDVMVSYGARKISDRYGLGALDRDPVADWVALGRRHRLDIVPWFEWGLKVPAASPLAQRHPAWLSADDSGRRTFDQDGTTTAYLNFTHPDVQRFYEDLAVEFVTRYDVPAIQFDDHLSLKNSFGYDDFTLARYREETGRAARPAPDDAEWLTWRAAKLTEFVARISRAVKTARPGVGLSVAPNPYPWSFRNYVQDWPSWVERGLVDEVIVQVYRNNLASFRGELGSPVLAGLVGKARLAIGVLAGQKPAPMPIDMVRAQTAMVREFGYGGVCYFFQESLLQFTAPGETVDSRADVIRALFPAPARPR